MVGNDVAMQQEVRLLEGMGDKSFSIETMNVRFHLVVREL